MKWKKRRLPFCIFFLKEIKKRETKRKKKETEKEAEEKEEE